MAPRTVIPPSGQSGSLEDALATLTVLVREQPGNFEYRVRLAGILERAGALARAVDVYRDYLHRYPGSPAAHFNLALLLKRLKCYEESIREYRLALDLGISDPAEVLSNMGLVYSEMRNAAEAERAFLRALELDPVRIAALFNLAGLYEELGRRDDAAERYREIRRIDPEFDEALCRLAYLGDPDADNSHLLADLEAASTKPQSDPVVQEALHFALGKLLDDGGAFDRSLEHYDIANRYGTHRVLPYDRQRTTAAFDAIIETFTPAWVEASSLDREEAPVFICGLFRSGSTLAEQLLARHSTVMAGGEVDFLSWAVSRYLAPFPEAVRDADRRLLEQVAGDYLGNLRKLFPTAGTVTDKRPDNFLFIGLIAALFPRARVVHTTRNVFDNCISIYFQQLGGYLGYATDIANVAHYYVQYRRLMSHWRTLPGNRIFDLEHEALVEDPGSSVREVASFLNVDWIPEGREISGQMIKTASVWQARQSINRRGHARWRNYPALVERITAELPAEYLPRSWPVT